MYDLLVLGGGPGGAAAARRAAASKRKRLKGAVSAQKSSLTQIPRFRVLRRRILPAKA